MIDLKKVTQQLASLGLQQRQSQLEMIQAAHSAFLNKKIQLIEAPTGTGKTLSYALAAYYAKQDKQVIVISTATVALQEQLINKDLPLLSRLLDKPLRYALAKGRRRYICHAKLHTAGSQQELFSGSGPSPRALQIKLDNKSWDGDRDTLDQTIEDKQWNSYSTDSLGCSGKLCQFYEQCAYYRARKAMFNSDFVVTNHSLLLSDLVLGGGTLLPKPEKSLYVIDECHHLPEKALDHFARNVSILSASDWINQLVKQIGKATQLQHIGSSHHPIMLASAEQLTEGLQAFHDWLANNQTQFKDCVWRYVASSDTTALDLAKPLITHSKKMCLQGNDLLNELEEKLENSDSQQHKILYGDLISQFGYLLLRLENLKETWSLFCEPQAQGEAPLARWFSHNKPSPFKLDNKATQYYCHVAPINISKPLQTLFWNKVEHGVVLCSATVRALGDFKDYLRKTGLTHEMRAQEILIEPFFDYTPSILYIPKMKHEPSGVNTTAHLEECIALLPQLLLPSSGTLVLFTSIRAMETIYEGLDQPLTADILMQGTQGKAKLLKTHAEKIKAGQRSILFGLASFGEGLDLPSKLCQHVIIHKLPFAVPTDPIELTRSEWLEHNNKNPFMLATLPSTSIRLTQYVGRLIRKEEDIGVVTLLDRRLISKFYGKKLLNNLPAFTRLFDTDWQTLHNTDTIKALFAKETNPTKEVEHV